MALSTEHWACQSHKHNQKVFFPLSLSRYSLFTSAVACCLLLNYFYINYSKVLAYLCIRNELFGMKCGELNVVESMVELQRTKSQSHKWARHTERQQQQQKHKKKKSNLLFPWDMKVNLNIICVFLFFSIRVGVFSLPHPFPVVNGTWKGMRFIRVL